MYLSYLYLSPSILIIPKISILPRLEGKQRKLTKLRHLPAAALSPRSMNSHIYMGDLISSERNTIRILRNGYQMAWV